MSPAENETILEYFEDMNRFQSEAEVISTNLEGDRTAIILNRTILYPQGGGQPSDKGWITSVDEETKFVVDDVRSKSGIVYHYGYFASESDTSRNSFAVGQDVITQVNESLRNWHSRLHSAGHLIDACIFKFKQGSLEASKAYHFPDSPFVEYIGSVEKTELETLRNNIEITANELINRGGQVEALITGYAQAEQLCGGKLPEHISKDSDPRIVQVGGMWCPCGGTHVRDLAEIGSMEIPQVRVKKGNTKVFYKIKES